MFDFSTLKTNRDWRVYIQTLIAHSDRAVERAILAIYKNQTCEEMLKCKSIEENKVGFGKVDAKEMSVLAQKLLKGEKLSEGEFARARNKMKKYWKQLMHISKKNIEAKKASTY